MAARRLMIVMLVLLGISLITATLVPVPDREGTDTTTTTSSAEGITAPREREGSRLLQRTIREGAGKAEEVRVEVGDQLRLTVRARHPDEVELAGLGELAYVDPYAPAVFDLRAFEPGSHAVRLLEADRVIGRVVIEDPAVRG
jgi:hypothetical protein